MRVEDLRTMARLGRAFWADPKRGEPITAETLSAVSMLALTDERAIERAACALLERARKESLGPRLHEPFFRLHPEDRFILVALHAARWSYARVARVLSLAPEQVEELAWKARVELAAQKNTSLRSYPVAGGNGLHCPEYNPNHPWTQRFFDEEFGSGREKLFLQNHLMACDSCRRALMLCREVYFSVEALIPRFDSMDQEDALVQEFSRLNRQGKRLRDPSQLSFSDSLRIFFKRADVQFALLALALFVLALSQ